jgi:apolipoprotein N-acyltransferase
MNQGAKLARFLWPLTKPFLAGGLFAMSFAPIEWRWASGLALVLLLLLLQNKTPRQAFMVGGMFGLGLFSIGASWIYSAFGYAQVHGVFAVFLTAFFVGFLALFPAVLAALSQRFLTGLSLWWMPGVFGLAWVVFEFLRGWLFNGFPWLLIGYTVLDTPLEAWVPLLGVWGVGFLVAYFAALLAQTFLSRGARRLQLISVSLVMLAPLPWLSAISWTQSTGQLKDVALVQLSISQDQKWRPERLVPTLEAYTSETRSVLGVDLVVWPETAIPAYWHQVQQYFEPLVLDAKRAGTEIISGVVLRTLTGDYNAVISLTEPHQFYAKTRLVPFAEYFPFHALFEFLSGLFSIPFATFDAGQTWQPPMMVGSVAMGVSVCYETAFAREAFKQLPQAGFLVNVTNEAWFDGTFEPWQLREMARMRALESGRYVLRANSTFSSIIDDKGRVLKDLAEGERGVLRYEVPVYQGETPYVKWVRWVNF